MSADLLALAGRCEVAVGPDLLLDQDVARAMGWRFVKEGHPFGCVWYDELGRARALLPFTGSLDAALTVTNGSPWSVNDPANADGARSVFGYPSRCYAWVQGSPDEHTYAATPALALCAAALRARHTIRSSHDGQ